MYLKTIRVTRETRNTMTEEDFGLVSARKPRLGLFCAKITNRSKKLSEDLSRLSRLLYPWIPCRLAVFSYELVQLLTTQVQQIMAGGCRSF
jgi:hypothetical protein